MKNKKRFYVLSFFSIIFFWLGWLLLWHVISAEEFIYIWSLLACFFLALVFLLISNLVERETKKILLLSGICIFGSIVLAFGHWLSMLGIIVLCLLLMWLGISRIKDEQRNRIKVNVYMTLRRGMPILGLVVSILIASGFYFFLTERQKVSKVPTINVEIPQQFTNEAIQALSLLGFGENIELIAQGVTVDEYLRRSIITESGDGKPMLPSEMPDDSMLLEEGRKLLSEQFGVELSGDEKMNEVIDEMVEKRIYKIVNGQISDAPLLPFGAAVALFVVLSSLSWILGIVVIWTSVGIFYILSKLQIVKIREENRVTEIIE